jgi:GDPmannose 4,6-dehydratase
MQWMMLQQDKPQDFVIATGVQYSVRDFIDWTAAQLGITVNLKVRAWMKWRWSPPSTATSAPALKVGDVVVKVDPRYFRPTEVETLLGDPAKAKSELGWMPEITAHDMCGRDGGQRPGRRPRQHALLKTHGYRVNVSVE